MLSFAVVFVDEGAKTLVHSSFVACWVNLGSLCKVLGSSVVVAHLVLANTEVVPTAIVFRINFSCSLVNLCLLVYVVGESCSVEQFFNGEALRIVVESFFEFSIALADDVH